MLLSRVTLRGELTGRRHLFSVGPGDLLCGLGLLPLQQPLPAAQLRPQLPQSVAVLSFLQTLLQQSSSAAQALPHMPQFSLEVAASGASLSMQPGGSMSPQRLYCGAIAPHLS